MMRGRHEIHDVDTNQSMLSFTYPPRESIAIPESCTIDVANARPGPAFSVTWWPKDLNHEGNKRYTYYSGKDELGYIAVAEANLQVF
jgi:hypothetical protein